MKHWALAGLLCLSRLQAQTIIQLDPQLSQQDFEGWGVSLCWWGNQVGQWSDSHLTPLIDLVVNPDSGLGYNIFRYNIGGGDNPAHNHITQFKAIPGFKATETGAYDWTADPYQRKVAELLSARGKNVVWEAFSNSPPWWMTQNQCSGGAQDGSDNLKPAYFSAFADYLTDVIQHLQDSAGLRFRTLEPFNEPSSGWWNGTAQPQEGCGFTNNQAQLIQLLGQKIRAKNLTTVLSIADENTIAQAVDGLKKYHDSDLALVAQFNTHSYSGWDRRADFAALRGKYGKRLWMSESGPLNRPAGGTLWDVGLWMADVIIKDVRDMQVNAWVDWQLIDASQNWRSVDANQNAQTFVPNKNFYLHAQFSRFIRPGAKILQSPVDNVLAAYVPATGNGVVVILNPDSTATHAYAIDVSKFPQAAANASVYRTSNTENLAKLADVAVQNGKFTVTTSPKSLTTYLIQVSVPSAIRPVRANPSSLSAQGMRLEKNGEVFDPGTGRGSVDATGRAGPEE